MQISSYSREVILNFTAPAEGMFINDSDDHVPVIYENGKWYPVQLGAALQ